MEELTLHGAREAHEAHEAVQRGNSRVRGKAVNIVMVRGNKAPTAALRLLYETAARLAA